MAYTTIDDPSAYFQTALWTGNGSARSITLDGNSDMQPDWVWIKRRNSARNHALLDSVRGGSKQLKSNSSDAEGTDAQLITSFDSDGFSLGTSNDCNSSSDTFVGWSWKASGSTASNTDGSITSTVSANTTAGFSIISYTGTATNNETIGHGLGVAPKITIFKRRNGTPNWRVQTTVIDGSYDSLYLNTTGAKFNSNETAPTSSVITIDNGDEVNASGGTYIAYSFAEKQGYSKFGKYTGNGNANGTFIYTGFKPAFLIIKPSSKSEEWMLMDGTRDLDNAVDSNLYANQNYAEADHDRLDILSNGFKVRTDSGHLNTSSATMIYMAFAENPFVTSTGIPTTAR